MTELEAKILVLKLITEQTLCCPETFSLTLEEYYVGRRQPNVCRYACFSGDTFGFTQEFRGAGWIGLWKSISNNTDAEGPSYVVDWRNNSDYKKSELLLETE